MISTPPEIAGGSSGGRVEAPVRGGVIAHSSPCQPPLAERIERALVVLAYFIELDGDVHIPMYEKFEAELEDLRRAQATRKRARELLARYAEPRRPEGDTFQEL